MEHVILHSSYTSMALTDHSSFDLQIMCEWSSAAHLWQNNLPGKSLCVRTNCWTPAADPPLPPVYFAGIFWNSRLKLWQSILAWDLRSSVCLVKLGLRYVYPSYMLCRPLLDVSSTISVQARPKSAFIMVIHERCTSP